MTEFEKNFLAGNGFEEVSPRHYERGMSKTVNVAFYGETESRFTVEIFFLASGTYRVVYTKDHSVIKNKIYSFGWNRTVNAIRSTVEYAGFTL